MKDKLLFLTIGLLIGIVVMQAGFTSRTVVVPVAHAEVPPTGLIFADGSHFMDEQGQVWWLTEANHEAQWAFAGTWPAPVPVPVSEIKFWSAAGKYVVAIDNTGYLWDDYYGRWNMVVWPGGQPVPTEGSSWGSIKSNLEGND